ncbi:hypothetical protein [Muricoccus radiodurans]|uniref:hypothetical protein n=1 Tax=Muricoccus radiodurans TaxID=2231721 RepID=UPI003CE7BE32
MMRALLLAPLLLAACATGPTLPERLATYVGRSEAELVGSLGVPVRTYDAGGQRFLQFEERRNVAMPGDTFLYGRGLYGARAWVGSPAAYVPVQCDLTFALRAGRVEGFSYRGDGCPAHASL